MRTTETMPSRAHVGLQDARVVVAASAIGIVRPGGDAPHPLTIRLATGTHRLDETLVLPDGVGLVGGGPA